MIDVLKIKEKTEANCIQVTVRLGLLKVSAWYDSECIRSVNIFKVEELETRSYPTDYIIGVMQDSLIAQEKDTENISISLEEVKGILASIALSDHLGDAGEAVYVLMEKVGLPNMELTVDDLRKNDMLPIYLADNT